MMTPEELRLEIERMMLEAKSRNDDPMVASLEKLALLPPDQQAEILPKLAQDYEGRETSLRDDLETNYAMLTQDAPRGEVAGNNQFSVYVGASPLEHLASGIQKYSAGKGIRENRAGLEKLSTDKEQALSAVQQMYLAEALRQKEEEEKRRFQMPGKVY